MRSTRLFVVLLCMIATCSLSASAQLSEKDLSALQTRAASEGWTFSVGPTSATARSWQDLCGLRPPKDWREKGRFVTPGEKAALPAAFDWRTVTGCPPVRDQGGCGSCWAFGTVGPLECNILIKDGITVDLSEQWLVSCNQETESPEVALTGTWNCIDGGWWAHDYHQGAKTDPCGGTGAVPESSFPYEADDLPCNCPYPHTYTIDSWAYVGSESDVPSVDAIKQAILDYGPISVAILVDVEFASYHQGVFNVNHTGEPNHAVVLVGWDDNQGTNGVWFLRNSWGTDWGEDGYMRIAYGVSMVGYGACFVQYSGATAGAGPEIQRQPEGARLFEGDGYHLSVEATGTGGLHYAWEHNGEGVGEDSPDLVLQPARADDAGMYVCQVSDVIGTTTSNAVELDVVPASELPTLGPLGLLLLCAIIVKNRDW